MHRFVDVVVNAARSNVLLLQKPLIFFELGLHEFGNLGSGDSNARFAVYIHNTAIGGAGCQDDAQPSVAGHCEVEPAGRTLLKLPDKGPEFGNLKQITRIFIVTVDTEEHAARARFEEGITRFRPEVMKETPCITRFDLLFGDEIDEAGVVPVPIP